MSPQNKRALLSQMMRRMQRAKCFPLSFAQQRLWFLNQMDPGAPVYNVPLAARITGPLQVDALEKSLNRVVRRHDILRTTFGTGEDGAAVQVVAPSLGLPLPVIDLGDACRTEQEAAVQRFAVEEARRPFDLARGPLVRADLLRLRDHDHVLFLTMHHIVSDVWSLGVLMRDAMAFYEAFVTDRPPL